MPGNFRLEHIEHDKLIFDVDCGDINSQEIIARKLQITAKDLRSYIESSDFSKTVVEELIDKKGRDKSEGENFQVDAYKVFYIQDDFVYVAFWAEGCEDWLKAPKKLYQGFNDVVHPKVPLNIKTSFGVPITDYAPMYETKYPIFIYTYIESEDPVITHLKGRVDLDKLTQDACSAINSGIVNGTVRASHIIGSPVQNPLTGIDNPEPKQLNVVMKRGALLDKPYTFTHLPYPEPTSLAALQALITLNQQENSQINYAATNRKDSQKTATEIQTATREAARLSSVQVDEFSDFCLAVYSYCFLLYQNRVLQGKIPVSNRVLPYLGRKNNDESWGVVLFTLRPSGDVDVIKRAEKLQKQMQFWPVISNTAIAEVFLMDILRTAFPEDSEKYIAEMNKATNRKLQDSVKLIQELGATIQSLVTDENGNLKPEYQEFAPQLGQIKQRIMNVSQAG